MGKASRAKGQRGQNEWKHYIDGEVLARAGYDGPDVKGPPLSIPNIIWWEVKRRKVLPQWLESWMEQAEQQVVEYATPNDVPAIAFRRDGGEWWVMAPARHLTSDE